MRIVNSDGQDYSTECMSFLLFLNSNIVNLYLIDENMKTSTLSVWFSVLLIVTTAVKVSGNPDDSEDDKAVAESLANMLRAGRTVISRQQDLINNPAIGDKGLSGSKVLGSALAIYQETTGTDPKSIDPASRLGRLLHAEEDAIVDVIDSNQSTLNQPGLGFKGFIPATFGRLVSEAFTKRVAREAEIKVTAPPGLIRNRKARPDDWEGQIIDQKLISPSWKKDAIYAAVAPNKGRTAYRFVSPEYYLPSCLSCHGSPKGEIDITGYPKEGAAEGDLGGVISVTLYR
jgi:hypothetical protein